MTRVLRHAPGRNLCAALLLAVAVIPARASAPPPSPENAVKAAFLVNFTLFVEWPDRALPGGDAPVTIGVWGENPFGQLLQDIVRERSGKGRPVRIVEVRSVEEASACQVVFLSGSEEDLRSRLEKLGPQPVLTVGDAPGFLADGGMIRFVTVGNKVRFEVDDKAAARSELKLSSRLLQLAVKEDGR